MDIPCHSMCEGCILARNGGYMAEGAVTTPIVPNLNAHGFIDNTLSLTVVKIWKYSDSKIMDIPYDAMCKGSVLARKGGIFGSRC